MKQQSGSSNTHSADHQLSNSGQQESGRNQPKNSVCVNIKQNYLIQTPQSSGSQNIEINVESTVHTSQGDTSTTQISTSTNIFKKEPPDTSTSNPSSNGSMSIGIDDVDELQKILDDLEQPLSGPDPILGDLECFPDFKNKSDSEHTQSLGQNTSSTNTNCGESESETAKQNLVPHVNRENFFDAQKSCSQYSMNKNFSHQQSREMYTPEANAQYSNIAGSSVGGYNRQQAPMVQNQTGQAMPPSIPSFADTGPAAKTLQQMAAHHQSHLNVPNPYGGEGFMTDGRTTNMSNYGRQGYMDPHAINGAYPGHYNQNMCNMPMYVKGQGQGMKPENAGQAPYVGPTKPLSHYEMSGQPVSTDNSLQSSHIPGQSAMKGQHSQANSQNGIHMTQSQQVSVSSSHARMNLSQTQQMQVQSENNNPVTLNQQQSFHMSNNSEQQRPNIPPQQKSQQHPVNPAAAASSQNMSQGTYMHMYREKMMQQEMRNRMHQQQMHQQTQFSGRPPPSYQANPGAARHGGGATNPLQTMQNMVEQTNQGSSDSSLQGPIKQNNIPGHSMPQISQNSTTHPAAPPPQTTTYQSGNSNQSNAGPAVNVTSSSSVKTETSSYTSAIMRGQRPPNVNVGPEGLNISQPKMNQWRQMGPSPVQGVMNRLPTDSNHQMAQYQNFGAHTMGNPNMYQYRMQMAQHQSMHMVAHQQHHQQHHHHQQQQRLPMTGAVNTMNSVSATGMPPSHQMRGPAPHNLPQSQRSVAMMMNQQQHMHHLHHHPHQQQMNGNQVMGGAVLPTQHQANTGMPGTGGHNNTNYSLDFLDQNQQPGPPDLFDPVQNANPTEFNFEDILAGK